MSRLGATKGPGKPGYLLITLAVLALDQWSKWLVEVKIARFESIEVIPGFFNLIHTQNTGVAFGLFPADGELRGTLLLAGAGLLALTVISVYFYRTPKHERLLQVALSLILGGAIGNLTDRLIWHRVTDFLDVYVSTHHWPTFNVADSAISVGIVALAIETLRPLRRSDEDEDVASPARSRAA